MQLHVIPASSRAERPLKADGGLSLTAEQFFYAVLETRKFCFGTCTYVNTLCQFLLQLLCMYSNERPQTDSTYTFKSSVRN